MNNEQLYNIKDMVFFLDFKNAIIGKGRITKVALTSGDSFEYAIEHEIYTEYGRGDKCSTIINEEYIWSDANQMINSFTKIIHSIRDSCYISHYLTDVTMTRIFKDREVKL